MLKADDLGVMLQQNFIFILTCFHYLQILYSDHVLLAGKGERIKKLQIKNPINLCLLKAWKEMYQVHDPDAL